MRFFKLCMVLISLWILSQVSLVQAATFNVTNEAELIAAVNTANSNGVADVIDLGGNVIEITSPNAASYGDIGLPFITSEMTIQNGTIRRNSATAFRIMRTAPGSIVTLDNLIIENGLLTVNVYDGGGIVNDGVLTIRNSIIRNNTTGRSAGGIYNGGSLTIVNSLIHNNVSTGSTGGAIVNFGTDLTIINSTIANNSAAGGTGGVLFEPFVVQNSIFWGNSGNQLSVSNTPSDPFSATNSIIQGGFAGTGNSSANPLFVNAGAGDYSLSAFSPAIDRADATLLPGGITTDLAGNTRQVDDPGIANTPSSLDRGAYEYQGTSSYTVSVTANDPAAAESPLNNGQFTIALDHSNQTGSALTVNYSVGGTATSGADYTALSGSVSIANGAQNATVNVVPINDDFAEASETVALTLTTTSNPTLVTVNVTPATVTITSEDVAGAMITPASLVISEAGGTDSFDIALTSEPLNDVTFSLTSSDITACTISVASLTFTPANWNIAQSVTVTGVDDNSVNAGGNRLCTVATAAATSADGNYNTLNFADVAVTVTDDDVAGIMVNPLSIMVSEPNITDTFDIRLNTLPANPVTINLSSSDPSACDVSPASVILSDQTPELVTVSAVDDFLINPGGQRTCTILTAAATSSDGDYNGLDAADVDVTVLDNEVSGSGNISISPSDVEFVVFNSGFYSIVLLSQPTAPVTIASYGTNGCEMFPGTITFQPSDWNVPQQMMIGSHVIGECNIVHVVSSADANFDGLSAGVINVVVLPSIGVFDPAISKIGLLVPGQVGVTGEQLEWIVTVTNNGGAVGQNVTIVDNVDSRLSVLNVNAPGATTSINGNTVSVTYATLAPGANVQFSIFTTVLDGVDVTNTACITSPNVCATGGTIGALPQTGETPFWRPAIIGVLMSASIK